MRKAEMAAMPKRTVLRPLYRYSCASPVLATEQPVWGGGLHGPYHLDVLLVEEVAEDKENVDCSHDPSEDRAGGQGGGEGEGEPMKATWGYLKMEVQGTKPPSWKQMLKTPGIDMMITMISCSEDLERKRNQTTWVTKSGFVYKG